MNKENYDSAKDKKRLYDKKYHIQHAEKYRENTRRWTLNNLDRKKKSNRTYYLKNKERIAEEGKINRKSNPEKFQERHKKYYENNKELINRNQKIYANIKRGKEIKSKIEARRNRNLGFHVIAKFKDYRILSPIDFHHIDNENVIEIPKWLHIKCNNNKINPHREKVRLLMRDFLTPEYYNIIDFEKFEKYANR